jgi:hypothetical protein
MPTMLLIGAGGESRIAPAYPDPGNLKTSPSGGRSSRYSTSKAGAKLIQVRGTSHSTNLDVNSLANGDLDVASAATFGTATTLHQN